jgi:hypothetical protein
MQISSTFLEYIEKPFSEKYHQASKEIAKHARKMRAK